MTHVEMIAVIEHHRNGGLIESRPRHCGGGWSPDSIPVWDFNRYEYRPKELPIVRWGIIWSSGKASPHFFKEREEAEDYAGRGGGGRVIKMVEVEE